MARAYASGAMEQTVAVMVRSVQKKGKVGDRVITIGERWHVCESTEVKVKL